MTRTAHRLQVLGWLALASLPAGAGTLHNLFIDPQDGAFDMTQWLGTRSGFMPVPIVVTEPAIGYGGGAALVFFHDSISNRLTKAEANAGGRLSTPSLSAVGAFYTENDSWGAGAFHRGVWREDTVRYLGGVAYGSLNLKFHGHDGGDRDQSVAYGLDAPALLQDIQLRLGDSDAFAGLRYLYSRVETDIEFGHVVPGVPDQDLKVSNAGLGLTLEYDAVDNMFTPNRGLKIESDLMMYDEIVGGDFDYLICAATVKGYTPIRSNLVLGLRTALELSSGDPPFFAVPFIDLRGIPALRYQDAHVAVAELEARWDVTLRWSLVGFGGAGWTTDSLDEFGDSIARVAGGGGVRYLLARGFRLRGGIDVAWGPEDTVFYITVGNA